MHRSDFTLIAHVIAEAGDDGDKCHPVRMSVLAEISQSMARALASTNPRFDRERFLAACNVPGGSATGDRMESSHADSVSPWR